MTQQPTPDQYSPYYQGYITKAGGGNILESLKLSLGEAKTLIDQIPADKWDYSYGPGKWTIKEILIHIIDAERVFAYRALRVARNDQTPMPGFDQDDYVPTSGAKDRSPRSVAEELMAVRMATIALFENFSTAMWTHKGTASDHTITALALAHIIVGHQRHHAEILLERYLDVEQY